MSLAYPHATVNNDSTALNELASIIRDQQCSTIVIGMPRNMSGGVTEQSKKTQLFADSLASHLKKLSIDVMINFQDESLTSVKAEQELNEKRIPYSKEDVDKLAAVHILEDYLRR